MKEFGLGNSFTIPARHPRQKGLTAGLTVCLATTFGLAAVPSGSAAATIPVACCADTACKGSISNPNYTLRIAINHAVDGDTVDMGSLPLSCSTITLTGGEIAIPQANLRINGPPGRTVTVSGNNVGRVFYHNGAGVLTLNNFEVANGKTVGSGGCIYSIGPTNLSGMTASHCSAGVVGGGIGVGGALQIHNSTVTGSGASAGGGIYGAGYILATSTSITNNHADSNGGGVLAKGTIHLDNVVLDNNGADTGYGGGLFGNDAKVVASLVSHNTARRGGAGLAIFSASYFGATGSTIMSNGTYDTYYGGGVMASASTIKILNSTISGNEAQQGGGAWLYASGTLFLYNSTVALNRATIYFGGIAAFSPSIWLQSSIIASNSSLLALHGLDFGLFDSGTHQISGAHNLIMSTEEAPVGTLTADPQLTPLALHGGVLPTHALSIGSAAIDHGGNPASFPSDERGTGFARTVGTAADIGAYERQPDDDQLFYGGFE